MHVGAISSAMWYSYEQFYVSADITSHQHSRNYTLVYYIVIVIAPKHE